MTTTARSFFAFVLFAAAAASAHGQGTGGTDLARELYRTRVAAAEAFLQLNKISTARKYLDATAGPERGLEWSFLNASLDRSDTTVTRAGGAFTCIQFSPDGRTVALGGSDGVISLHEYPGLRPLKDLVGHTGSVTSVSFNGDGTRLASGGRDHSVIVWDLSSGDQATRNDTSFSQGIYQVRFSPDDSLVGVVSWKRDPARTPPIVGFASLIGARDGKERIRMETDAHPAAGIRFLPDGRTVIVSTWGEIVHAFDAASGATKWTYDLSDYQEYNAFHSIDLSPDGKAVAVGSADHRIHILDVADGSVIRRIEPWEGHTKIVKAVAYSRDGKWLASAGEDQTILTWNTSGYTRGASLVGHVGSVGGLAWSADGGVLLSTSEDTTLRAWNVLRPFERSYEICDFGPWQTPLTADGRFFAAACSDKRLAIYDAATGTVRDSLGAQSGLAAVFSGDSKRLITASFDGIVRAWDVEAGKELRTFEGHTARVDGVAFLNSADNALSVGDSTLRVWSLSSGAAVATVKFQNAPFRVVLPPDERVAYVGFNDGEVKVIDTRTWGETGSFRCGAGIQEMAVSPDGGMLAVFSGRNIEVWATKSLGRIHLLQGHERSGYGIGFSPDGRHIVSGSNDQTFRIWDLSDGSCTLTYHGYEDTIYSCKFLGGRELLLTSSQGKVWYYRF